MAGHASPVPSRGAAGWPRSLVSACEMPCRTPTAHLFESIARYRLPILRRVVAASPEISSRRIDQSSLPLRPRVRGARVAIAPGGYAKPMTIARGTATTRVAAAAAGMPCPARNESDADNPPVRSREAEEDWGR